MAGRLQRTRRDGRRLAALGLVMLVGAITTIDSGGYLYGGPLYLVYPHVLLAIEIETVLLSSPFVLAFGLVAMTGRLDKNDPKRRAKARANPVV